MADAASPTATRTDGWTEGWTGTRARLAEYFDRTAHDQWVALTSDAPVSKVRATVRAGRDEMRATLLSWLPADMTGLRLLDAGCGTGALAVEAAARGAEVVAVDLSPGLVRIAAERTPPALRSRIRYAAGDMLSPDHGRFDHVVCMDSLIHYPAADIARALRALSARTGRSILFTFAPATPLLRSMHAIGKLFPRADRAPMIAPVGRSHLSRELRGESRWHEGRDRRVARGFYTSHALEWVREGGARA